MIIITIKSKLCDQHIICFNLRKSGKKKTTFKAEVYFIVLTEALSFE